MPQSMIVFSPMRNAVLTQGGSVGLLLRVQALDQPQTTPGLQQPGRSLIARCASPESNRLE